MSDGTSIEAGYSGQYLDSPASLVPVSSDTSERQTARTLAARHDHALSSASGLPLTLEDGMPVAVVTSKPVSMACKRAMDIALSLVALVMLAPVLVFIALAIKLTSSGPVLFKQAREGIGGKPIGVYKFRSMYVDRCDPSGVAQTVVGDMRVTPIGRVIRRTNIDELPQLINIIKGDMSLIGPRPHPFGMLAGGKPYGVLVPYYSQRQAMKPGLSGWAQANGLRGPTEDPDLARARIDHDLAYISNFSLWLDIRIIALTLLRELSGGSGN